MGNFMQDERYGLRVLVKSPGFTTVAVLSLTLGIGANTTIFTLAKAIFLHSIPVKDPGSVVVLYSTAQSRKGAATAIPADPVLECRRLSRKDR